MAGPGWYSIEAFADSIAELCREFGLPPAVFLGHSLGGPLSVRFATRHPGLTKAIVLVAGTVDVFAEALGGRHLGRNLRHHPRTVGRLRPGDGLGQLRCPVIAIGADHDAISPLPDLAAFAQAVPAARTVVLEGTGHMVMLERPDAFNTEITRFLDRLLREGETAPADPAPSPGRTQPQQDRPGQTRRIPGNDSTP